jgi:hypothetical protein
MPHTDFHFSTGTLFIKPNGGQLNPNPTPIRLGTLQDMSGQIKRASESLFGQNQLPDDTAPGQIDITGKASWASIQGVYLLNSFLLGASSTGGTSIVDNEAHAVPAVTPFTITITPPGSGTFSQDLGVVYSASGLQLTCIGATGTPTIGEYTVTAEGEYTFAAADEGAGVLISYQYTAAAGFNTYSFQNQKMGVGPTVSIYLYMPYNNLNRYLVFGNARINSISLPTKQKGYVIQELDFTAFDVPGGNFMQLVGVN